jgi:hypothetical protein
MLLLIIIKHYIIYTCNCSPLFDTITIAPRCAHYSCQRWQLSYACMASVNDVELTCYGCLAYTQSCCTEVYHIVLCCAVQPLCCCRFVKTELLPLIEDQRNRMAEVRIHLYMCTSDIAQFFFSDMRKY